LTPIGKSVGLVDKTRWKKFEKKLSDIDKLKNYLTQTRTGGSSLWDILRRPQNTLAEKLPDNEFVKNEHFSKEVVDAVIIDAKYAGYLEKQNRLVEAMHTLEKKKIPFALDYCSISHLRAEAKEKLSAFRPATLAQASRIGGITPADITVIQVHLKKYF
jgi:tRNA uridine 5-carboxymethylaminomethyl modification enzyme